MELSSLAIDFLSRPYLVLKHEQLRRYYDRHEKKQNPVDWDKSRLNPKNRIDSFDTSGTKWRIDGATACATQFFAVPIHLLGECEPLRIDVFIRDQLQHPSYLRDDLGSNLGVSFQDNRAFARLGISHHICRALDEHCIQDPSFLERYRKLPFGSRLVFPSINQNPKTMQPFVIPAFDLEREALSILSLKELWPDIPEERWPATIDISRLRFVRQIHESITLVHIVEEGVGEGQDVVFKSNTEHLAYLYNELRFLLRCPSHPNIMSAPTRLVTKRSNFGGKIGVFGFLLPYYHQGCIRNILPSLSLEQKLKICLEVTSAVVHIWERCGTFYSDLRPDNVLMSGPEDYSGNHKGNAVLCDFEQRGNHYDWSPPEILPSLYLENLQPSDGFKALCDLNKWTYLGDFSDRVHVPPKRKYQSRTDAHSLNRPWAQLDSQQQESAMVFTLGLFIYALFEGLGDLRRSIMHNYPTSCDGEFPQMRLVPPSARNLIWRCTRGAPEWGIDGWCAKESIVNASMLSQKAGYIIPMEESQTDVRDQITVTSTIAAALQWWRTELNWADSTLEYLKGKDVDLGGTRPRLRDVLVTLQDVAINHDI